MNSNCCGAKIIGHGKRDSAVCSDCKENCVGEEEEILVPTVWLQSIYNLSQKAERELDAGRSGEVAIIRLLGFASSAKTLINKK